MEKHVCERCGIEFLGQPKRRFCGRTCASRTRAEGAVRWATYQCKTCGKDVTVKPRYVNRYMYCKECLRESRIQRMKAVRGERSYVPCALCGTPFYKPPSSKALACSKKCAGEMRRGVPLGRKPPTRTTSLGKGGYRKDINLYVRSRWEANYARYLTWKNTPYTYEPQAFVIKLPDGTEHGYTPDFLVNGNHFVELKGWVRDDRRQREVLWAAVRQLPLPLIVIESSAYRELEAEVASKIEHWEYHWSAADPHAKRHCKFCGKEIHSASVRAVFCSRQCCGASKKSRSGKTCPICSTAFEVSRWDKDRKFCSVDCTNEAKRRGLVVTHPRLNLKGST